MFWERAVNVSFTDQLVEWHHQLVESSRLDALRPLRGFCCAANDFCQRILVYLRRVERLSSQPLRGPELCTVLFTAPILYISSLMGSEGLFLHTFPKARRNRGQNGDAGRCDAKQVRRLWHRHGRAVTPRGDSPASLRCLAPFPPCARSRTRSWRVSSPLLLSLIHI